MVEFGAQLPNSGVVYMTSKSLEFIAAWITEYSTATPLQLVQREWVGESHGRWHM